MNKIKIFQNQEFGAIRTISNEQGDVMFCGRDVAAALGYKKPEWAIATHVEADDSAKRGVIDSLGREQQAIFINESGLYALILSSKLDSAKRFKHWVTSEVLPSIRKQGGYLVARPEETDEEIARLKPRAEYADHVLDSITCITTTQLAKELGMTAQQLNRRLCELHVQYWQSGQYMLYAEYARQGFAKNRTRTHTVVDGTVLTEVYLVWTERGRDFIHRLLNPMYAS